MLRSRTGSQTVPDGVENKSKEASPKRRRREDDRADAGTGATANWNPVMRLLIRECWTDGSLMAVKEDVISGITLGVTQIAPSIAFALMGGGPPLIGLFCSFFLGAISCVLGGRPGQITAIAGAVVVLYPPLVEKHGYEAVCVVSFFTGVLLFILGVLRVARYITLLPSTVMVGFCNGLAISMVMHQIPSFKDANGEYPTGLNAVYVSLLCIFTYCVMMLLPYFTTILPSTFVAIVLGTIINYAFQIKSTTIGDLYQLHGDFPSPKLPDVAWSSKSFWVDVLESSLVTFIVTCVESLMSDYKIQQMTETHTNFSRESCGLGIAFMVNGFFQGMPGCVVFGPCVLNIENGTGTRRLSSFICALLMAIVPLALYPVIALLPMPVLSAVVFGVSSKTADWRMFAMIFLQRISFQEAVVALTVTIVTAVSNLAIATGAGFAAALLFFMWNMSRGRVSMKPHTETIVITNQPLPDPPTPISLVRPIETGCPSFPPLERRFSGPAADKRSVSFLSRNDTNASGGVGGGSAAAAGLHVSFNLTDVQSPGDNGLAPGVVCEEAEPRPPPHDTEMVPTLQGVDDELKSQGLVERLGEETGYGRSANNEGSVSKSVMDGGDIHKEGQMDAEFAQVEIDPLNQEEVVFSVREGNLEDREEMNLSPLENSTSALGFTAAGPATQGAGTDVEVEAETGQPSFGNGSIRLTVVNSSLAIRSAQVDMNFLQIQEDQTFPEVKVLRVKLCGVLFFGSCTDFVDGMMDLLHSYHSQLFLRVTDFIFDFQGGLMPILDYSAAEALETTALTLIKRGIRVHLQNMDPLSEVCVERARRYFPHIVEDKVDNVKEICYIRRVFNRGFTQRREPQEGDDPLDENVFVSVHTPQPTAAFSAFQETLSFEETVKVGFPVYLPDFGITVPVFDTIAGWRSRSTDRQPFYTDDDLSRGVTDDPPFDRRFGEFGKEWWRRLRNKDFTHASSNAAPHPVAMGHPRPPPRVFVQVPRFPGQGFGKKEKLSAVEMAAVKRAVLALWDIDDHRPPINCVMERVSIAYNLFLDGFV